MRDQIKQKIFLINALIQKMENKNKISLITILKNEISKLKELNNEYKAIINEKKIVHEEKTKGKIRYHLSDGSTYVISNDKKFRYLFDIKTRIITYEFENGQIERTFPNGIKEIRYPDGSVGVRHGNKEYDYLK